MMRCTLYTGAAQQRSRAHLQILKPCHVAHLEVRFAEHFLHHPELQPPFRLRKIWLVGNKLADAGLDDRFGALHAWEPRHVHDAALERYANPGGVVDCVALGMGTPHVLRAGLAAVPRLDIVAHSARKTVEARRSDLLVWPDNDGADPAAFFLAPAGDLMRQQHEPLVPGARKHSVRVLRSARVIKTRSTEKRPDDCRRVGAEPSGQARRGRRSHAPPCIHRGFETCFTETAQMIRWPH